MAADSFDRPYTIPVNHYADTVISNYLGTVPIFDVRMFNAICPNGDTATFDYQGNTYYQMCAANSTSDGSHFIDHTTINKGFFVLLNELIKVNTAVSIENQKLNRPVFNNKLLRNLDSQMYDIRGNHTYGLKTGIYLVFDKITKTYYKKIIIN